MKASHHVMSAGIFAVMVIAVLMLSMVLPFNAAARPVAPVGSVASPAHAVAAQAATTAKAASPAAKVTPSAGGSPHPGTLEYYFVAPQGQTSEDPSLAYDTVSYEPIINVYQTLVAYNGTSTSSFVPELSTCVPGANDGTLSTPSVSCQAKYGNSLIKDNAQGQPQFWTFPIDPNAKFYDPSTGTSWNVYPSDIMFTLARTMGLADLPGPGVLNGWIITQSLLPFGNPKWDGGIHTPCNNTPQSVLGSMMVNDTGYCPASALAASGCITFNAYGQGQDWPFSWSSSGMLLAPAWSHAVGSRLSRLVWRASPGPRRPTATGRASFREGRPAPTTRPSRASSARSVRPPGTRSSCWRSTTRPSKTAFDSTRSGLGPTTSLRTAPRPVTR